MPEIFYASFSQDVRNTKPLELLSETVQTKPNYESFYIKATQNQKL